MARTKTVSDEQIKEVLIAAGGFISTAAKKLNLTSRAIYLRIQASEELGEAVKSIRESFLDLAESQLIKNVKAGDNASIFFFLKCQGKHRGYVERQEHIIVKEVELNNAIDIELEKLADRKQIATIGSTKEKVLH